MKDELKKLEEKLQAHFAEVNKLSEKELAELLNKIDALHNQGQEVKSTATSSKVVKYSWEESTDVERLFALQESTKDKDELAALERKINTLLGGDPISTATNSKNNSGYDLYKQIASDKIEPTANNIARSMGVLKDNESLQFLITLDLRADVKFADVVAFTFLEDNYKAFDKTKPIFLNITIGGHHTLIAFVEDRAVYMDSLGKGNREAKDYAKKVCDILGIKDFRDISQKQQYANCCGLSAAYNAASIHKACSESRNLEDSHILVRDQNWEEFYSFLGENFLHQSQEKPKEQNTSKPNESNSTSVLSSVVEPKVTTATTVDKPTALPSTKEPIVVGGGVSGDNRSAVARARAKVMERRNNAKPVKSIEDLQLQSKQVADKMSACIANGTAYSKEFDALCEQAVELEAQLHKARSMLKAASDNKVDELKTKHGVVNSSSTSLTRTPEGGARSGIAIPGTVAKKVEAAGSTKGKEAADSRKI